MNEALDAAQADIGFQFFLARLFGQAIVVHHNQKELHGYEWRDRFYVVHVIPLATPEPNPDSHP